MDSVTIVANVGLGPDTYRLLREPAEHQTSDGIDRYCHIAVCDEVEVESVVEQIEDRYNTTLTEADNA